MTKIFKLIEYTVPNFLIKHIILTIDLTQNPVKSTAKLSISVNPASKDTSGDLVLDGENMQLTSIFLNEKPLNPDQYQLTPKNLTIKNVPTDKPFTLETTCLLGTDTDLFGLYETEGTILVKAETEGMRRVLYCMDRPDVLASYTTTIIAEHDKYPVLLSNGVQTEQKQLANGNHCVTWTDPFPKPSYLFALVAGTLQRSATSFTTKSGREIPIVFYVPPAATPKCDFAKEVLKQAMHWDEENFQIECDLPQHMIAGVDRYASGASEPTGLNLFNTENLFATPAIKTDFGTLRVLEVIAHEFFHTLTGDRVTIRDWFNLAWKEGLTTFRAAMFREDLFGRDLIRLLDGKNFDERAPRPETYTAVRSLYTAAAYEKSADIFRMIMLTIGKDKFYQGLTDFLKSNYGTAVTLEDILEFLNAPHYLPWFTESGIPDLFVTDTYNKQTKRYTLKVQTTDAKSRPIPLLIGLINQQGQEILEDTLLIVAADEQTFVFENIQSPPIPSLLRSLSAPVHLKYEYCENDLLVLMRYDTNLYNRCNASKALIIQLVQTYCAGTIIQLSPQFYSCYRELMNDPALNQWMLAEILTLPSEEELIDTCSKADFDKIAQARTFIMNSLAEALHTEFMQLFSSLKLQQKVTDPQIAFFDIRDAGKRRLMSLCCNYLLITDREIIKNYLLELFHNSLQTNMTDTTNALISLCELNCPEADAALIDFYQHWHQDTNAINYWFKIQASTHSNQVVKRVKNLLTDPAFDISNPNKVNAVIGIFIKNTYGFHAASGQGYALVKEVILSLDKLNPALAGRLTEAFLTLNKFDAKRQQLMLDNLLEIKDKCVSADVKNIANRVICDTLEK